MTPAAPDHAGLALHLRGLGKCFGARRVLRDIDLEVAPGTFVAVVGASGCGKSTLLRLLAQLEPASSGQLLTSGLRPLAARRHDIRLVFQDARLLPWKTVRDNVALGLTGRDAGARAQEALVAVGLGDRGGDWPAVLSGGQRQRVALARALVHAPRLLLLDEPLAALDALTRLSMQRLIESLWLRHRFTAVLVTHDVAEAVAMADRVLLIDDGSIALDWPLELPRPRDAPAVAPAAALAQRRLLDRLLRR